MNINIDSFIKTGSSHMLFEDAVITGLSPFPYIIVSDGCSSSENTHLGSHILSRSAEIELKESGYFHADFGSSVIYRARSMADLLGLNYSSLDATLLISYVKEGKVSIFMSGDGSVYYNKNGVINKKSFEFAGNAPYYLSYILNPLRDEKYSKMINDFKLENNDSNMFKKIINVKDKDILVNGINPKSSFNFELNEEDLTFLILSTDGIDSFGLAEQENAGINEIDEKLCGFKNFNGDFLQRRLKRLLKEELKHGRVNSDDLGVAAFHFEKE